MVRESADAPHTLSRSNASVQGRTGPDSGGTGSALSPGAGASAAASVRMHPQISTTYRKESALTTGSPSRSVVIACRKQVQPLSACADPQANIMPWPPA